MKPNKLTEEVFTNVKRAINNGEWTYAWKYPQINRATGNRIKKSSDYEEYVGEDGKYGVGVQKQMTKSQPDTVVATSPTPLVATKRSSSSKSFFYWYFALYRYSYRILKKLLVERRSSD